MKKVALKTYNNCKYNPGSLLKRVGWYIVSCLFFRTAIPWPSSLKALLLRLFGAHVGNSPCIKPHVHIKYPWFLHLGDTVWIGEKVWIDNLAMVTIQDNVCISQKSFLLTGSHDYAKSSFDLVVKPLRIESGAWIGARTTVCPGVVCKSHSVLCVGSVATHDLDCYGIYQGNPALKKRERVIRD